MPKFRKKPVVIEAELLTKDNLTEVADWCAGTRDLDRREKPYQEVVIIPTLEGRMMAEIGDFVIQGVKGEFYPCKPDIFEATYEPVEEAA